jgi:hypothetical protein
VTVETLINKLVGASGSTAKGAPQGVTSVRLRNHVVSGVRYALVPMERRLEDHLGSDERA